MFTVTLLKLQVIGSENQTLNFSPGHPVKISGLEQRREYTFRVSYGITKNSWNSLQWFKCLYHINFEVQLIGIEMYVI